MSTDGFRMMSQLLILYVLLIVGISTTTPPANPAYAVQCWKPNPLLLPGVFKDCVEVIDTVTVGHDPTTPYKFSDDPALRPDIKLPHTWRLRGHNCIVGLQWNPEKTGYDRTTLRDIKGAALSAAIQCVIKAPHLGGTVVVGWEHSMVVNVLTLKAPDLSEKHDNGTLSNE